MRTRQLLALNRREIIVVSSRHGAKRIRVLGSAAREDDLPERDIDFLVEMEPGCSLFDLADLTSELSDLLDRKVDVVIESSLYWLLRRRILKEARPL